MIIYLVADLGNKRVYVWLTNWLHGQQIDYQEVLV